MDSPDVETVLRQPPGPVESIPDVATGQENQRWRLGEPGWPSVAAFGVITILYLLASEEVTLGPSWLLPVIIVALLPPLAVPGHHVLRRRVGLALVAVVTMALIASTWLLVVQLPTADLPADVLLRSAALIWLTNILVFAVWYSEIDSSGLVGRMPGGYSSRDFQFPQLTIGGPVAQGWVPGFIDYLFLAFTTSTAFGPSDTHVLSRRAKLLMMLQAVISLVVIAMIAARGISLLN